MEVVLGVLAEAASGKLQTAFSLFQIVTIKMLWMHLAGHVLKVNSHSMI